jgi:hypothetical protein
MAVGAAQVRLAYKTPPLRTAGSVVVLIRLHEPFLGFVVKYTMSGVAPGPGSPLALMHGLNPRDRNGVTLGYQICVQLLR